MKLVLAYYAYALGRPEECLSLLSEIQNLEDVHSRIASYETLRSDSPLQSISLSSLSEGSASTSRTGSFVSTSAGGRIDVDEGRLWAVTECLRSLTLQGVW